MGISGNFLSDTTSTVDPNTSGWAVKLNCTLARGTGGTVTDGCLAVRSVASGEMQARTVASYPVIQGTEYEAFADASGATVPERIGIRWLSASNAEIGITWSLTTSSASATWHRIAVADWAPDGATQAQVLLSSTPAAGAVFSYYDNIYLGLPQRTTGNLLSANAETSERASGWEYTAVTNCTIARTVPPVNWAATAYSGGGHVATMTVTTNGAAEFRSTDWPTVTPGREYLAYAYLNPPASGSAAWIELRFYNAAFAQIQATRSVLNAPSTGWYRQRVSDYAPAGAVYATVAFGLSTATAGQVLRTDGAVILASPVVYAGSVVPYKDASIEQGIGAWTVASGVGALARVEPWGTDALDGAYSMSVSSATATTTTIRSARYPIGAAAGQAWTVQTGLKVSAGSWNFSRGIRWYDATNTDLGLSIGSAVAAPTPGWWWLASQYTAPAGATQAAVELILTATATSSVIRLDRVGLWQSVPVAEATVNPVTASVLVTFRELTSGTITVWRITPDGTRTLVRGSTGLIDGLAWTADTLVIEDYEAPLTVPVTYYAEVRSGGAVTQTRLAGPVTVPHDDPNLAWLRDPGNPQRNMMVMVRRAPDWQREIAQSEYRVRGRRNSVVLSDVRGGLAGDLAVWTRSDEERAALHWLLDSGNTLLWQAAPGMGVDDTYVNVGAVTEARTTPYAPELWREWTLPLKQADQPVSVGVASSAGRTWQDILTEYGTWNDVLSAFATWEKVLLNQPK
ncbi:MULTISPECIES: hypothetical protein [unclassified Streptomyces]|uniref:hypothetical protein n=1 Tax=unclassified Streptomyces TaxID=2593676 RepID=UPI000DD90B90|nr:MULTISPECIES: hypothetical protein [unclassified Streptomyces]QZZ26516.1 hypothetical protein A7X85_09845 [Streptomyces sp. ST1015]